MMCNIMNYLYKKQNGFETLKDKVSELVYKLLHL